MSMYGNMRHSAEIIRAMYGKDSRQTFNTSAQDDVLISISSYSSSWQSTIRTCTYKYVFYEKHFYKCCRDMLTRRSRRSGTDQFMLDRLIGGCGE